LIANPLLENQGDNWLTQVHVKNLLLFLSAVTSHRTSNMKNIHILHIILL